MQLVWRNNGGFIKELLDSKEGEKVPYTSLASTLAKLKTKGSVKTVRYANANRYEAQIAEEDYKKAFMHGVVANSFRNSYKELVSFFAKEEKSSAEEINEIVDMITNERTFGITSSRAR